MLDQAFESLKTYDWGTDRKPLAEIDNAVIVSHGEEAARKDLENRLAAVLKSDVSRDAKDFACRKLMIIGTAASVPTLAELLPDKDLAHMARFALERIPAPEAAQALRNALPKLNGPLKIGVIGSLGVRRDTESVASLARLLSDSDAAIARAAAFALGDIRTSEAAAALSAMQSASSEVKPAVTDASLFCAEGLLADGKKGEALAVFKAYAGEGQPKHVRLAATKGMLACAGKKE
ncbi:MAG TPA: HEAT repeat domain-containing protein [Pirellulales bacterium]